MFVLEILVNGYWEMVAEFFDTAEDAELYYRCQVGECDAFRVVESEEV